MRRKRFISFQNVDVSAVERRFEKRVNARFVFYNTAIIDFGGGFRFAIEVYFKRCRTVGITSFETHRNAGFRPVGIGYRAGRALVFAERSVAGQIGNRRVRNAVRRHARVFVIAAEKKFLPESERERFRRAVSVAEIFLAEASAGADVTVAFVDAVNYERAVLESARKPRAVTRFFAVFHIKTFAFRFIIGKDEFIRFGFASSALRGKQRVFAGSKDGRDIFALAQKSDFIKDVRKRHTRRFAAVTGSHYVEFAHKFLVRRLVRISVGRAENVHKLVTRHRGIRIAPLFKHGIRKENIVVNRPIAQLLRFNIHAGIFFVHYVSAFQIVCLTREINALFRPEQTILGGRFVKSEYESETICRAVAVAVRFGFAGYFFVRRRNEFLTPQKFVRAFFRTVRVGLAVRVKSPVVVAVFVDSDIRRIVGRICVSGREIIGGKA